jgi:hypothetical protein
VWSGTQAAIVADGMNLRLKTQITPDPVSPVDDRHNL